MPEYAERTCNKHGLVPFVLEGRGYYRCTKCRSDAVQKRRKTIKRLAVEYKGGKCEFCGYNKCINALEFHHKDPNGKDFGISHKGYTRSFDEVRVEVDKCFLLCANCHREEHAKTDEEMAT